MTPHDFVHKWRTLIGSPAFSEIGYYQPHITDLCLLVNHPAPTDTDIEHQPFIFEKQVTKEQGGKGRADVWYKGRFAIEYKQPGADLDVAYKQLLQYRESLQNPPLLIVSDFRRLLIHTNFTNAVNYAVTLTLDDLLTAAGLQQLRNVFFNVEAFRPQTTAAQVTEEAAAIFGRLAAHLGKWGHDPQAVAHYLIRMLFCLFAEDIGLLPKDLFTRLVAQGKRDPKSFNAKIRQLFAAMSEGSAFGEHDIRYFNGGLFDDDAIVEMDADALGILDRVSTLDWSAIEPAIFGTLFTRSLDPSQRAKLGAQYTSKDDILLIVEPVLMAPLRREWATIQAQAQDLARKRDGASTRAATTRAQNELSSLILDFTQKLATVRVLDPAAGSGNFLYVSMRLLLELWKEVSIFASGLGLSLLTPLPGLAPSPLQLYGIEINDYAHELAQATVWIGYLQWLHDNGFGLPEEPILKPLDNIKHMDAILAYDSGGRPVEPQWQETDVIVGNPPFLGAKWAKRELGQKYKADLWNLYKGSVGGKADLVMFWFEKARKQVKDGCAKRAGLLGTNTIRQGDSAVVLKRIITTGNIFFAVTDHPWLLDGASLNVVMVGFDAGEEQERSLNGVLVGSISADLSAHGDVSSARPLRENANLSYRGHERGGPFLLSKDQVTGFLLVPKNKDVLFPWFSGTDLTDRDRCEWVIDFGEMSYEEAQQYPIVLDYLREAWSANKSAIRRSRWWIHRRTAADLRTALIGRSRFIVTPLVSKYRIFVWLETNTRPDTRLVAVARSDDYFIGVLHSRLHELWSLRLGARHGVGNDPTYNNTTCFETYPFPWPPSQEPQDDPRLHAIADAARDLVAQRDTWLNPPDLTEKELAKRTLTNLYNQRPDWLDAAHKRLDAAVLDAYGWPHDLGDEEILARLLELNLVRARQEQVSQSAKAI